MHGQQNFKKNEATNITDSELHTLCNRKSLNEQQNFPLKKGSQKRTQIHL
jgi:hypothetical protein